MCSSIARSTLSKIPALTMIALTIVREMMNTAADVKAGRHRAASHKSSGNSISTGTITSDQGSGRKKMTATIAAATETSAAMPTKISARGGGARKTDPSPIIKGATVMTPIASDENQCCQVTSAGTSGLCSSL